MLALVELGESGEVSVFSLSTNNRRKISPYGAGALSMSSAGSVKELGKITKTIKFRGFIGMILKLKTLLEMDFRLKKRERGFKKLA